MRKIIPPLLFGGPVILFLVGDIAALVFLAHGDWDVRVGVPLQILAFYGIGIGLMARSEAIREALHLSEDMTSHNLYRFTRGNLLFLSLFFGFMAAGADTRGRRSGLSTLGVGLMMLLAPFAFLYSVFHLVVIMPLSYPGYVLASAVVGSVQSAGGGLQWDVHSGEEVKVLSVRELVQSNATVAKSFLLGIPAALLALVTRLAALFL